MKALYLTYDGLTDPLGQAQILPYLLGLAKKGHDISIISFEKSQNKHELSNTRQTINHNNLKWYPLYYTKNPPILSTLFDLYKLTRTCKKLLHREKFNIVHCRSYITSLIGLYLKLQYGLKFIFDMRGFWADERVDGKIWNLKSPVYKLVYNYFKRKEKQFLKNADYIISLTFKAEKIIQSWQLKTDPLPISVIPTCVDTDHFDPNNLNKIKLFDLKATLNINSDRFIISYLGSLGTWYLVEEMIDFFSALKSKIPDASFLIITRDSTDFFRQISEKYNFDKDDLIFVNASRDEVPYYLTLSNWTLFFIKPVFSKSASAPTKMAEITNMKKPILFNLGVGDMDIFHSEYRIGYGIKEMNAEEFEKAADYISQNRSITVNNQIVEDYYKLEDAINKLDEIYLSLGKSQ